MGSLNAYVRDESRSTGRYDWDTNFVAMQWGEMFGAEGDAFVLKGGCVTSKTENWFVESYKRVAIYNFVRTCVSKNAGFFVSS